MFIVITNQKGGVGKSTIAVHLATWLHDQGHRTALLDADKQRSSSQWARLAEPNLTVETADSPDVCLTQAKHLLADHQFVIGDGPGGIDDVSRTILLLADLALFPISPSILDVWSVQQATSILRYAQQINGGHPTGQLVLNKMRTRDTISRELVQAAPGLGLGVAGSVLRDLQAYRDAAQQGTTVTRMGRKGSAASQEIVRLFQGVINTDVKPSINQEIGNG